MRVCCFIGKFWRCVVVCLEMIKSKPFMRGFVRLLWFIRRWKLSFESFDYLLTVVAFCIVKVAAWFEEDCRTSYDRKFDLDLLRFWCCTEVGKIFHAFEFTNFSLLKRVSSEWIIKRLEHYIRKKSSNGPTVLTVEHLSVGFKIWLLFLVFSWLLLSQALD